MTIRINTDNLHNGDESHQHYFTSEIATKLHYHKSKITKIDTYLSDEKHESWTSILCLIVAQLNNKEHITIKHIDNNMELAVFGAIDKLKSTLMNITE